jgi:predicted DNA-binding ribbon-helix-helix protein
MASNQTEKLIDVIADFHVELKRKSEKLAAAVKARFAELLKNPELVNDEITLQFLEAEIAATDLPDDFWDFIADLQDLTFDELMSQEVEERGEAWEMAWTIRVAVARRQAMIEAGDIVGSMIFGIQTADERAPLEERLDIEEFAQTVNLKAKIKEKLTDVVA